MILRQKAKAFIIACCMVVILSGCSTVSYYHLVPPHNTNPEKVNDVISSLSAILKNDKFETTDTFDIRFYGMTGFKSNDNIEFISKFKRGFVEKMWIYPDEYHVEYVYVIRWKKALTIVTFTPSEKISMREINAKISHQFKELIANKEIQLITRPYIYLN